MTDPTRPCASCLAPFKDHGTKARNCGAFKPGMMIHLLKLPGYMYYDLMKDQRNFHIISAPMDLMTGDVLAFQLWDPLTGNLAAGVIVSGTGVIVEGAEWGLPPGVRVIQLVQPQETPRLRAFRESILKSKQN